MDFLGSPNGGVIDREESSNDPSSSLRISSSFDNTDDENEFNVATCSINVKWGKSYSPIGRAFVNGGKSSSSCPSSSAI